MDYSYESEHTKFMRELLEKNPQLEEKRMAARGVWWDKKLDKANDPMKPYVYFGG